MTSTSALRSIGVIGLGVMGRNLALNIDSHGFSVSVHDQSREAVARCVASHPEAGAVAEGFAGFEAIDAFVASLERPRRILVMVNAGAPVDDVVERLSAWLEPGDVVVDGGNSHYRDTQRRCAALAGRGVHFVGTGVSGGEEGARKGPSIMPGGSDEGWRRFRPVFEAIAAKVDGQPCVTHIGADGAGHFVKMVHNGIEYADMQLIGETYALMKAAGLTNHAMADVFARWNEGPLQSYLIEITAHILRQGDPRSGAALVDVILDKAEQKGTGQWAVVAAAEAGAAASVIAAAVDARVLSSMKPARVAASRVFAGPRQGIAVVDGGVWVDTLHDALLASKIVAYAQGFDLMRRVGDAQGWQLRPNAIARIWRGGCIIRARFLDRIAQAYEAQPDLRHLVMADAFVRELSRTQTAWREVTGTAVAGGISVPAMSAALGWFDAFRTERLPANLLQAQRDFFGAHTYERIDAAEGERFHTEWPTTGQG